MAAQIANASRQSLRQLSFSKNSIFMHGLGWRTGREQIIEYFEKFGKVEKVFVHMNVYRGVSKGYAQLRFKDESSLSAALSNSDHVIDGHSVNIKVAHGGKKVETTS